MQKILLSKKVTNLQFPVLAEKDEDGFYVVECPVLEGCYSQGETLDQALKNIREVIQLVFNKNLKLITNFINTYVKTI
ncbi:MAG: type II toxin-antitoxin system HicB family antitoxin [Patescibacteria group bacterium]|nr:type II toxin-antitoxin system HicB family antitoxin [Patescibacteria group bacterium]MBU1350186.1 type II toxin-antitoxin system HicB family antitoxin [Patescibacteria group bacterium]MBU1421279.1 type II toxin-antitoxin system HicB family antitoxin [Patescibacteria group bacterium]MBU2415700.1 type II toxin-antitoxin system HicB family antitoxin [Patescibacteria group bacterium]MBU2456688.1 type II toxin-antitoxin system HicB family antitoxin [Patescibacteria group bacterium]